MNSHVGRWTALFALLTTLSACATDDGEASVDAGTDVVSTTDSNETDAAGDATGPTAAKPFPAGFRFGVATSAHQVEGGQHNTWTEYETLPQFAGRTAEPSGDAADHYNRYEEDFDLAAGMSLDVFRISIEWSRIEPERGVYDADEIQHYRDVFEAMEARDLAPSVTLHHFTEPAWWSNLENLEEPFVDTFCQDGPSNTDFCAWMNPEAPQVFAAFCAKMAQEYGAYVDEWMTFNEPQAYWVATTVMAEFPPPLSVPLLGGKPEDMEQYAVPTMRAMLEAHSLCYDAIHENDTIDADGDGDPAVVGFATGTGALRPADPAKEADIEAAEQAEWVATFLFFDVFDSGMLDTDFDMVPDEPHPEWAGKIDILGLQYYAATVIVGVPLHPLLWGVPCMNLDEPMLETALRNAGCPEPPTDDFPMDDGPDPAFFGRQHDPEGLLEVLRKLSDRYPGLPLVITENGFANFDKKRAYSIVRHLDVCHEAIEEGIPLEGYYHWSMLDNFEWAFGFGVRYGLFSVDFDGDLSRTPTFAVDVYRQICEARGLTQELLDTYAGTGELPVDE